MKIPSRKVDPSPLPVESERHSACTASFMKEKTERELAQTNIAENRKAFHDFHLLGMFEAGIVLSEPR